MGKNSQWKYPQPGFDPDGFVYQEISKASAGMSDAQAIKLIVTEWAKARRGEHTSLWGVSFEPSTPGSGQAPREIEKEQAPTPAPAKRITGPLTPPPSTPVPTPEEPPEQAPRRASKNKNIAKAAMSIDFLD
jgi:hypothetical protein